MNLAVSIGLNIIALAGIVCCLSFIFASKKLLAGLSLAWILIFNIPLWNGVCVIMSMRYLMCLA